MYLFITYFLSSLLLSSSTRRSLLSAIFWTSRGQVSSLLPPGTCLHFYRAWGSAFPLRVDFHRMLLTHALALSAYQFLFKKKSLRVCALSESWIHEIDFSRHEDRSFFGKCVRIIRRKSRRKKSETYREKPTSSSESATTIVGIHTCGYWIMHTTTILIVQVDSRW